MTAAAFTLILAALAVTAWAYVDARRDARQAHDAHTFEAEDHERTREEAANRLAVIRLLLDEHARTVVMDPLGTDLMPDEPKLRAVKR